MDDLLREFLTETSESLDTVDNQLVRFEQEPNNARILDNVFRLVHTIKGTCGFLGLPRLEALAHAGETLMGKFRDGMPVTAEAVTLILSSIDRIKEILAGLEATEAEPEGNDRDLIDQLEAMVERGEAAMAVSPAPAAPEPPARVPAAASGATRGTLVQQTLERQLRPGEVSLDELERAFRETAVDVAPATAKAPAQSTVETPHEPTAAVKEPRHPGSFRQVPQRPIPPKAIALPTSRSALTWTLSNT
jgi:two-component system, chemotaxis family, sensor kinase CheA